MLTSDIAPSVVFPRSCAVNFDKINTLSMVDFLSRITASTLLFRATKYHISKEILLWSCGRLIKKCLVCVF